MLVGDVLAMGVVGVVIELCQLSARSVQLGLSVERSVGHAAVALVQHGLHVHSGIVSTLVSFDNENDYFLSF